MLPWYFSLLPWETQGLFPKKKNQKTPTKKKQARKRHEESLLFFRTEYFTILIAQIQYQILVFQAFKPVFNKTCQLLTGPRLWSFLTLRGSKYNNLLPTAAVFSTKISLASLPTENTQLGKVYISLHIVNTMHCSGTLTMRRHNARSALN